jgi:hypothetical protein
VCLAVIGAARRREARPYVAIAAVGVVLSLGPYIHVNGVVHDSVLLPYGWLQQVVPAIDFSGMPIRFVWLATFGIAVAAGGGVVVMGRRGRRAAALLVAAAIVETAPRPFVTSRWPTIPVFAEWASDRSSWAVLDATDWGRALWDQTQHGHPIVAGYVSRVPSDVWATMKANPGLSAFFNPPIGPAAGGRARGVASDTNSALRDMNVKYVVIESARRRICDELGMRQVYQYDDLAVFAVP